ncbi:hypothetical protein FD19_GL001240 [Lacticaseibacillus thailandensis DSM 22698 = JCM 13996]|uniref:Uncharacterized protein n=1 Tax=Lacticaseibacillus thailandensis DSM 22698 = JCM 13996 TaxID=1423810 RepID=A0A0R2C5P8_9LACO|nr:hypothetical protein FD19_GL001240 [Lacticaseibacillus thailandensis DSM 22698 = JCM 13996]
MVARHYLKEYTARGLAAPTATDGQWQILADMKTAGWHLPLPIPSSVQLRLTTLFLPQMMANVPDDPDPKLITLLENYAWWLDDQRFYYGWYEDSPFTDEELSSPEQQTAWREFQAEAAADAKKICTAIFGTGIPVASRNLDDDVCTEENWPLLTVLTNLRWHHIPYRFIPNNAATPQTGGELRVAGLCLYYTLYDFDALPRIELDYLDYLPN